MTARKDHLTLLLGNLCGVLDVFKNGIMGTEGDSSELRWRSGTNGEYTVKEGYALDFNWLMSKGNGGGETSWRDEAQSNWRSF